MEINILSPLSKEELLIKRPLAVMMAEAKILLLSLNLLEKATQW
jgi:hypothetical protein